MKTVRLSVNRISKSLFFLGCIYSSLALIVSYFEYQISTSTEIIELIRVPIEAMDIKCYGKTDFQSLDVYMTTFIKVIKNTSIEFMSESGDREELQSAIKSVSYYMRRLKTTTMLVAHVEFNENLTNIHVRRLHNQGRLIFVEDSHDKNRSSLFLSMTARKDISTMKSSSELLLSSNTMLLQVISQQLLPPPYATMCKRHSGSHVTCLDHCLLTMLGNESRLDKFNSRPFHKETNIEYSLNRKSIGVKCKEQCDRRPCEESFFGFSSLYFTYGTSIMSVALNEQKLVTSPSMTFEDLLIDLLKVVGIWVGLSISDCITSLTNGIIWLNNQRKSFAARPRFANRWAWRVSSS